MCWICIFVLTKICLRFAKSSCKFKKQGNGFIRKYVSQTNYNLMCSDVKSSHVSTKEQKLSLLSLASFQSLIYGPRTWIIKTLLTRILSKIDLVENIVWKQLFGINHYIYVDRTNSYYGIS